MNKLLKQAFTLIELLVAIAIIGILSGLIVVAMSGVNNKATIAKAQVFSNSLRNSLLGNIVGEWKLDGDATDTWGSNSGSTFGVTSSSDCIYGTCLSFAGASQYVDFGSNSSLVSVFDNSKAFSYAIWFYPTSLQASWSWVVCKAYTSHISPYYQIDLRLLSSGNMRSSIYNGAGAAYLPVVSSNTISLNTWNFAVVSIDLVNNTHKLYVNGILFGPTSVTAGTYTNHASPLALGANRNLYTSSIYNFIGKLDEFRLYNAVVPAFQIKEQYYTGLNSLLNSGQIDSEEYSLRINSIATNEQTN